MRLEFRGEAFNAFNTPRYAAPELFEGAPLTVRAEVYALAFLIELVALNGRKRLGAETVHAVLQY